MTTKPISIGPANLPTGLETALSGLTLQTKAHGLPTRQNSADSDRSSSASAVSGSPTSTRSSRRPSLSRHQSLASSPKRSPHALENILDLAQAHDATDAALLKAALVRAQGTPSVRDTLAPTQTRAERIHTAPLSRVPTGSHRWYTDAANPIVAGLLLRQTVASGTKGLHPHVSQMPGGVHLVHMVVPRSIDPMVARDLREVGQSRYAATLKQDLKTNKLFKVKFNGRTQPASDGYYACIIDQNDTLLVSLLSAKSQGAPAGAHANLAGGLPVRFAGELRIADGRVVWFNNASGHYRTPGYLVGQALSQPLLVDAQVTLIGI